MLSAAALANVQRHTPLVVGFSGGPDSAALLHALYAAGWPLVAAHLDHGLRPKSAAEAEAARQVAAGFGLVFESLRVDVAALARQEKQSIEAAARAARYRFLFAVAQQHGAQAVLTAHTADDQAETLLMHVLRGAGAQGLQGMPAYWLPNPWSDNVALVRPFLESSRAAVLAYCEAHALPVQHDPSNKDPAFFRNRVRHNLLPLMEELAPGVKTRLANTAAVQAAENEVLQAATEAAWRRCVSARGAGFIGVQRGTLAAEPLALQRRVLQRAAGELRPQSSALTFALIEQARSAPAAKDGEQDWFDGLVLLAEGPQLWLMERSAQLPAAWPQLPHTMLALETPAEVRLDAGWRLRLQEAAAPQATPADAYQAWLDTRRAIELVLRRPQPGDRLALPHGRQKLADVFINAKVPLRARAGWPLLCAGDEVVWAPGLRLAYGFAAAPGQAAVHAQLVPGRDW